jgi:hypothetical protein
LALSIQYEEESHPLSIFLYALKAPETKRQYPRRLKVFLDFLKLDGTLKQQSKEFLEKAKQNSSCMIFESNFNINITMETTCTTTCVTNY